MEAFQQPTSGKGRTNSPRAESPSLQIEHLSLRNSRTKICSRLGTYQTGLKSLFLASFWLFCRTCKLVFDLARTMVTSKIPRNRFFGVKIEVKKQRFRQKNHSSEMVGAGDLEPWAYLGR